MTKSMYLKFVDANVQGTITMYWDNAPKTCKALWGALKKPIRWDASHAMFSGPEIMMGLPETARNFNPLELPPENQTVQPDPGELLWFYQPKNFFKNDPTEFWEIGLFYDAGGRTFGQYAGAEKDAISHRGRAARRMIPVLRDLGFD